VMWIKRGGIWARERRGSSDSESYTNRVTVESVCVG
jgi:hypothetical protein